MVDQTPQPRPLSQHLRLGAASVLLAFLLVTSSLLAVPQVAGAFVVEAPDDTTIESDFKVSRYQVELAAVTGSALHRDLTGTQIRLTGEPEMVMLLPERGSHFALRSKNDGVWSAWVDVESPHEEAPDGLVGEEGAGSASTAIGPIWIGDASDVEVAALDNGGSVVVEVLESLDRPERALVTANVLPGQPTIQPKANWTDRGYVTDHEGCEDGPYLATNVRAAIVHHTVTSNSYVQSDVDNQLRGIYRLHVDINGWCDIAYNFVVDRFGTIWEARDGGVENPVIGGHAKGFNTWTVGIALLGQHQSGASPAAAVPTSAATASVQAIVGWKFGMHGVDPNGTTWLKNRSSNGVMKFPSDTWVELPTILGHRHVGVTSCPGSHTVPLLPAIRSNLAAGRVGDPPYSFVAHEPYEHGPGFAVLDVVGGLRPAGSAEQPLGELVPNGSTAIAVDGGPTGGYVLTDAGRLIDYGAAPTVSSNPSGSTPAVDLVVRADGSSGWVLDVDGNLHPFGGAPNRSVSSGPNGAVAVELDDGGNGYVLAGSQLRSVGDVPDHSQTPLAGAVAFGLLPDATGGWALTADGRLLPFGDAPDWQAVGAGSIDARAVFAAINGRGGWILDSEGRLRPFGDERPILPISTTVGVSTIVDGALVDWVTDESSDMMIFVNALTTLFLGEQLDPLEADFLGVRVVYEGRSVVVEELARSDAWSGRVVDEMYLDVLGRLPDEQGRRYWIDRLSNGLRTQDLGANFYGSPEYFEQSGGAEGFVTNLYRQLLDREPEQQGLDYWVQRLESGEAQPTDITVGFYQSPESRLGRVDKLYDQILQREPDPDGHQFWAEQLLVIDDIELAIELASSAEYYDVVTPDDDE